MATRAVRTSSEDTLARVFGRIDHIGLAVADLESAIELHTQTYGMPLVHRETIAEQGVEAVLLDVGESHVELLKPLADDTPVGKFLATRGPGLHHVAFRIGDSLDQLREARAKLEAAGVATTPIDHEVSKSLYIADPDGNGVELYVDGSDSWKQDPQRVAQIAPLEL